MKSDCILGILLYDNTYIYSLEECNITGEGGVDSIEELLG